MSEESLTETDGFFRRSSKGPLEVYKMNNVRRGRALIFNYEQFDPRLNMNPRFGSDTDCKNLQRSLKRLGFEVEVHKNLSKSDVDARLDEAANDDHSDADCLLVVYMSYAAHDPLVKSDNDYVDGDDDDDDEDEDEADECDTEDNVYAYDGKICIKTITDKFKGTECKTLVRKPKIFIWQVCCENEEEEVHDAVKKKKTSAGPASVKTLPAAADFIMCYAVAKGSFSHRHTKKGCWYIQDLCKMLEKYGDSLEFTKLLTLVNREVASREAFTSCDNSIEAKQIPCFASMLTKKLYFHPKH